MGVHAGAVIAEDRLGHEGHRHAVALRHVLADVLVPGQPVGHLDQRVEAHVDFGLAGRCDLVMLLLDADADALHLEHHLLADILQAVVGGHREVAFLVARLVAEVRTLFAAVPVALVRVDKVVARMLIAIEADAVENEELGLRAEVGGVADAGGLQVRLGLAGDVARVAAVVGSGDRILNRANQRQRRILHEGIHDRRVAVGNDQHVAVIDRLPAAD